MAGGSAAWVVLALLVLTAGPVALSGFASSGAEEVDPASCGCSLPLAGISLTPAQADDSQNYSFYGHSVDGWGFSNGTITSPGPTVTVHIGDRVSLTLFANDTAPHNWFLDYDNDSTPDVGEPSSPDYNGPGEPKTVTWSFIADRAGTFTYRCRFHPIRMIGTIVVLPEGRARNFTFAGHTVDGWGFSNETITSPGPQIVVGQGANVTLSLSATDTVRHNWFIDYDDDRTVDPGEPASPDFNGPGDPKTITWSFIAERAGTYAYRCVYHPALMVGTIVVVGTDTGPPRATGVGLIPGIMIATLGFVLAFAAMYHVRAVRARRRGRSEEGPR